MDAITVMKRYEVKYILNKDQLSYLRKALLEHMTVDEYGKTTISSLYYDTDDYRIIRASIEKPIFKEKMRLRSYGLSNGDSPVFLEIKRKAYHITYKRRVALQEEDAVNFIANKGYELGDDQISKEITYFRNYYKKLLPKILIIYERTAYKEIDGDIRLTIDENPRYRTYDLNLHTSNDGMLLLPNGSAILEIKVQEQMPLWLTEILSKGQIYKTTFSKVGTAYQRINTPHAIEERIERRLTV